MSNDGSTDSTPSGDFGANDWLVEEMYEAWVKDPTSVEASWIPTLQDVTLVPITTLLNRPRPEPAVAETR